MSEKPRLSIWKEIFAGFVTGFLVSPTNAIIDRSVIEYANGKQTIKEGVLSGFKQLLRRPVEFFGSFQFKWMFFVYGATYITNNLTDHFPIIPNTPLPIQNLFFTFVANTICGILKDKAYIQHFGVSQARAFPAASYVFLFLRDIITIASAFTIPPIFAEQIQHTTGASHHKSLTEAQIISPMLIQIIVTPFHLLGLDLYNREGVSLVGRLRHVKSLYPSTLSIRMIRFLPAYGIGGVVNTQLRQNIKE